MCAVQSSRWEAIAVLPSAFDGSVRFSRDAYHRMFEAGILDAHQRFELIGGAVYRQPRISPARASLMQRLTYFFVKRAPVNLQCRVRSPIVIGDHSEPEPSLSLVQNDDVNYRLRHPGLGDVVAVVDVVQDLPSTPLSAKLQMFGVAGIQEYWLLVVDRPIVIVHRDATTTGFDSLQQFGVDATIAPLAAPDCKLDLGWLFR